ncbi:Mu transposase C-terminal domain-containing protein [Klebsiella pneumoniae]|uniref:Mu transposase C-terminal domain-containing protein n=1 Tax=Klebsiella oxytoca TaxID=571 RepID=UPI001646A8BF|nr:Mu transposase C-terminal domain-containing protein [Klebsiella oxytoca]MBC4221129.1 transposase [Klebsiella pneumoniae]MBR7595418.1 transposase [Klebsiella oxytoca]MDY2089662.1 Mu transposase C-terminal domain-containing protein [Klebsiella pneumoniae]MDZ0274707.1 Mu transposase C-terminal domain-containing protein [Klebsiella pneumoniae]MDZ0291270.1 Mu transposase C-terminal domain-containing protein [Klebsiella pneumoniae]
MFATVNELVGLPGLPGTPQGIRAMMGKLVKDNQALVRKRQGSKAFEYHIDSLPPVTQKALRDRQVKELMKNQDAALPSPERSAVMEKSNTRLSLYRDHPVLMEQKLTGLTADQQKTADARIALVSEVLKLGEIPGFSCAKAIREIVRQSRSGELPEHLATQVTLANAKKGSSRTLSEISLKRWMADFKKARTSTERLVLLAPGKRQRVEPEEIAWLPDFLAYYRNPNGVTMAEAYDDFIKGWYTRYADQPEMLFSAPSYNTVRYAMDKLPEVVKQHRRITGSEARQLEGFVRRDWLCLPVNYVWIGDGHGMKMKVAHPDHGKPFSPEVTFILDGSCRFIVGWSLALSESVIAVADALRHGIRNNGVPYIYYSDNGGGETNNTFDANITGILPRLGIDHRLGIPENPQGRGIIEILNKTLGMRISRQFATYYGTGADKSTVRRVSKSLTAALNAVDKGRELTAKQEQTLREFPSWNELIGEIEAGIKWYNNRPHEALPLKGNGEHFTPAQFRKYKLEKEKTEIEWLSDAELRHGFMPQIERTVSRCEIRLFNNLYYSEALRDEHNRQVLVNYDLHDATKIIVSRMDGSLICEAFWDGNKKAAFPVTAEYWQKQQRIKGMRERGEERVRLAEAENVHTLSAPVAPDWVHSNIYHPVIKGTPAMQVVSEEEEYIEDEYLNNALDMLEKNERKSAI